jgi:hypothetical protein
VPNKTIYIKDEKMWLKAKELAAADGMSISALIDKLLREYLKEGQQRIKPCPCCGLRHLRKESA